MIEDLVRILRGCYPQHLDSQSNYSVRIDAEYVLDALEVAGMLPPKLPTHSHTFQTALNRYYTQDGVPLEAPDYFCKWEIE